MRPSAGPPGAGPVLTFGVRLAGTERCIGGPPASRTKLEGGGGPFEGGQEGLVCFRGLYPLSFGVGQGS